MAFCVHKKGCLGDFGDTIFGKVQLTRLITISCPAYANRRAAEVFKLQRERPDVPQRRMHTDLACYTPNRKGQLVFALTSITHLLHGNSNLRCSIYLTITCEGYRSEEILNQCGILSGGSGTVTEKMTGTQAALLLILDTNVQRHGKRDR